MPGSGAQKRSHAQAIRCYNLRQEGVDSEAIPRSQIADIVCIDKQKVRARILLGQRLVQLGEDND